MALDIEKLAADMLAAALPILKKDAADAEAFGKMEFAKLAQTIASIGEQLAAGTINQQQASLLLDMQKLAAQNVLLTLQGLGLLAVEAALNAALGAIKGAVNAAAKFVLIE